MLFHDPRGHTDTLAGIDLPEAARLFDPERTPTWELMERAGRLRDRSVGNRAHLCMILNARSGACSEDCAFCSQSVHHRCEVPVYPLVSPDRALEEARRAEEAGVRCFSLVTSGRELRDRRERNSILRIVERLRADTALEVGLSPGLAGLPFLEDLKRAGLTVFHHNLETAPGFYGRVCTTHPFEDRMRTLLDAAEAGLGLCSGGIFGLGETTRHRAELALLWKRLPLQRIPVNFLNPIPGTRLENQEKLSPMEALHVLAALRLLLPDREILVCGGRNAVLGSLQPLLFRAGADGIMTGNYLTTAGQGVEEDHRMLRDLGLEWLPSDPGHPSNSLLSRAPSRLSAERHPRESPRTSVEEGSFSEGAEKRVLPVITVRPELGEIPERVDLDVRGNDGNPSVPPEAHVERYPFLRQRIEDLKRGGRHRSLRRVDSPQAERIVLDGRPVRLFCSNNYLGLAGHPRVREAAAEAARSWGGGSGASRLISGNMRSHEELEERLERFMGSGAALLFNNGYTANVGILSSLVGKGDTLFSDALNHASIIDGCRLSRARVHVYRHRDAEHLESLLREARGSGRCLIVTDTLFSMEGDLAPLADLAALAREHDCLLMVDEAHAVGVMGPKGRGVAEHLGLTGAVDILVGTLGKALGSFGAFAACAPVVRDFLINHARSLIYSTSLPPPVLAAAGAALEIVQAEPERRERLRENARRFGAGLRAMGFPVPDPATHIQAVVTGDDGRAMTLCDNLLQQGVFAQGIRPPTVPAGSARIRFSLMATHTEEDIDAALEAIRISPEDEGTSPRGAAQSWGTQAPRGGRPTHPEQEESAHART